MKKYLSLFLVFTIIFTLTSCSGKKEEASIVSLLPVDKERASLEHAGAIATKQYIIARLKTDALLEYDFEKGNIDQLKVLTEDALRAWNLSEQISSQVVDLVDYAQKLAIFSSKKVANISYRIDKPRTVDFFTSPVYAAGENSALNWAKDLTEKFDSYPAGQKIKQLSEELGTDAKRAFAQLKMAQDILQGAVYNDEAEVFHQYEKAAKATSAACKTTLYVAGVVTGGGVANGLLEAGGIFIGGIDTMVTIAEAGSHIFLGENNKVTITLQDYQEVIGPISAVMGGIGLFTGDPIRAGMKVGADFSTKLGSLDKLGYITESIGELFNEGTILGGLFTIGDDGKTSVKISEISTEGKTTDEVAKELKEAGLPEPEEGESKTITELAEKMEKERYYTEDEVNEIIDNLRDVLYDAFLDSQEEAKEESPKKEPENQTSNPPIIGKAGPSIDEIVGTYGGLSWFEGDDERIEDGEVIIRKNEKGQLVDTDGGVFHYDQEKGIATLTDRTENYLAEVKYIFSYDNGGIHLSGTIEFKTDKSTAIIFVEMDKK